MTAETFNGYATFYWITTPGLAACRRSVPQSRFAEARPRRAVQGDARIDHEPERGPDFHVPLTTARNADSSISAKRAWGESEVALVHVPEYSLARPETVALQAPSQA